MNIKNDAYSGVHRQKTEDSYQYGGKKKTETATSDKNEAFKL